MTDIQYAETVGVAGAPMVFTFHGTGGSERQFHDFPNRILPGAHVVSPRGTVSEQGALRYFRRKAEGVYDMPDLEARRAQMADFVRARTESQMPARVIGMGYSNGANILAAMAMADGTLFSDMILMHPLIPWTPAPQPHLSGRRVLITAGERDPICPADQTRALAAWFEEQGADLQMHWHRGGHEIAPSEGEAIAGFLAALNGA